ncbi:glycosyl transferase group 1 [Planctopirus limnophila DSM 3776]|uniref:Glycosyl transferase group 1 n=1 Tax=Planctopirus limnophila (strain ATCC 43296 / DSM 3776 / IFAM 1008 / Mu 290) TaxID=521674 RepID=D5SZ70_PLAL2|nr:glycosyltransferase family 4 protein [Planctopirus limnophila]ADG69971.1 glycosyl transferase group 1 [Planctopirus limnophila DSM 3776]
MHTMHFITRLIVGGAQENTVSNVEDQVQLFGDEVTLVTGPGLGPEGSLEERAAKSGARLIVMPELHRAIRPWQDWRAYQELRRLIRTLKPDVIHTHASKAGIIGRQAGFVEGVPVVHTIHGASFHYGQSAPAYRLYRFLEQRAGRQTAHFISVSDAMTEQYVAARVAPREKFTTIRSGFDVQPYLSPVKSRAEIRAQLGLSESDLVVGKIARLFHLKGHQYLIAAAPEIVRQQPQVKFLLVGDGILREQYQAEIARLGLTDHFVFTGLVPPSQIPELIHAMDVVVHCSEWEGLARVLPQGLLAGKPVISYDIDGASEIVRPGETGYLLPRGDVPGLAKATIELLANPLLRQQYGQRGRELFQDVFRHEYMTQKIREIYATVAHPAKAIQALQ